jgi:hypothetical protein
MSVFDDINPEIPDFRKVFEAETMAESSIEYNLLYNMLKNITSREKPCESDHDCAIYFFIQSEDIWIYVKSPAAKQIFKINNRYIQKYNFDAYEYRLYDGRNVYKLPEYLYDSFNFVKRYWHYFCVKWMGSIEFDRYAYKSYKKYQKHIKYNK